MIYVFTLYILSAAVDGSIEMFVRYASKAETCCINFCHVRNSSNHGSGAAYWPSLPLCTSWQMTPNEAQTQTPK